MAGNQISKQSSWQRSRGFVLSLLLLATAIFTLVALMVPFFTNQINSQLKTGEVAAREIVAPRSLTYTSDILTESQQESAAESIAAIYSPPDTSIARHQLESLRATLAYINSVRADTHSSNEQKLADLAALEEILLDQETAQNILDLSDSRMQAVQQESIVVLEQVMRATIREDRLEAARNNVPTLVSLSLPEDQAAIVSEMVIGFVAPNSLYSEVLTETARQHARESVVPVERSFVQGQTILLRGQIISDTDIEALELFGLVKSETRWQDLVSAASLAILTLIYFLVYLSRNPELTQDLRGLTLIIILFIVFLVGGRLAVIVEYLRWAQPAG
jgi:membrane-associated HD superfamily phosphohydrolase